MSGITATCDSGNTVCVNQELLYLQVDLMVAVERFMELIEYGFDKRSNIR